MNIANSTDISTTSCTKKSIHYVLSRKHKSCCTADTYGYSRNVSYSTQCRCFASMVANMIVSLSSLSDRQQQSVTRLYRRESVGMPVPRLSSFLILPVEIRNALMSFFSFECPTMIRSSSSSVTRASMSSSLSSFDCVLYPGGSYSPNLILFFDMVANERWVASTAKASTAQDSPIPSYPWLPVLGYKIDHKVTKDAQWCDFQALRISAH